LVSLDTFCKKQRIPPDQAVAELRKAGFIVNSPKETLTRIAASRGTSGMGVYAVIKKLESEPEAMRPGAVWTPEKIEEAFAGTGLGRKTLGQIFQELAIDPETARNRLKKANIKARDDDSIKMLADMHHTTPINILTIILIGNG
jgi:hypothetical protein